MNPFRWLLNLSAAAANKRAGTVDPWAYSYDSTVDSREYEANTEVDGAHFFIGNLKAPERWAELSKSKARYARVIESHRGVYSLNVYERLNNTWQPFEGPSLFGTLDEAKNSAALLLTDAEHEANDLTSD